MVQPQRRWQEEEERHSNACLWGLQEPLNISLLVLSECVSPTIWVSTLHHRMNENLKEEGDLLLLGMSLVLLPCLVLFIQSSSFGRENP